ncbi:hypothetical protein Droror1_Dr00017183 [Drosera rotundifolia]
MSRKRATLLTINGLAASLSKVVVSSTHPIRSLNPICFHSSNLSTAIERSDFWPPNGANDENPVEKDRKFGGETQKGLGFWDSGTNYQKIGEFEGNLGAKRSEHGRENIGIGARHGVGDRLNFDGKSGNFDGFGGSRNFDGLGGTDGSRWGMEMKREAGIGNGSGSIMKPERLYDAVDANANGLGGGGGQGSRGGVNRQFSGAGAMLSPGNYGVENNVMSKQGTGFHDSSNSTEAFHVQNNGGHDAGKGRLNQPIWSNSNGSLTSNHQTPGYRPNVHQQFPSSPYTWNRGIPETTKHDYQQVNIGDFQSVRNESYLGSGTQYQMNPSYNVNSNVGPYQQFSKEYGNPSVHMQATFSSTPGEESAEPQPFEGTLEELDKACQESSTEDAVEILDLLDEKQIAVDLPRHLLLLKACAESKSLEEAKTVHEHLVRSLSPLDISTYNKIIETYSKCGSMQDAFDVFCVMPERNLTSWDTMITWLAKNELGEDALDVFTQFKQAGLTPDGQMFIGIFAACSVLGDVTEGMLHFESMSKSYGIVPTMDHYVAVVDMLCTSGYLEQAVEFIEKMPVEPSLQVWETLMNLCRIQGDLDLGNRCAKIIEELDPSYLNESSKAGLIPVRPSDIVKKEEKKKSGTESLLEIRSKVHEFRAGDKSAPDSDKIYQLLKGLKEQMKEEGYVAETRFVLHDVQQEEKEEAIMSHSERLAAASSFLKSPTRQEVRIIKNLRACVDCHNAFKIISRIVGRKFIMRDAKRFHHVENGKCSCNDYW